jgi:hypothetical protein
MTTHAQQELTMQDFGITEDEFQEFIDNLDPTGAGVPGFEVNIVTVDITPVEELVVDDHIYDVDPIPEPIIVGGLGVNNTETVREYEAFGVKLNDADDVISVSIVLAVVAIIYIGKSSIDYWFAARIERFKKKLNKE